MPLTEPFPSLSDITRLIGEAGKRLVQIGACEGAAGNISVFMGWEAYIERDFPRVAQYDLPIHVPELAGKVFVVTGSGRRLGEIAYDPEANLAIARINEGGTTCELHTSPRALFQKPTSEFNTHLALHRSAILRDNLNFHAIIHAQPLHLTYLSHLPEYQNTVTLSKRILRWQPETIVNLPMGVAYLPFELPGSPELMRATVGAMEQGHRVVLWAKHGVMARSDLSVKRAADRIEYAETGAHYEYLDLAAGGKASGLSDAELRQVNAKFGVGSPLF
ncbi:MAG: class II aldolase/adducin family protein [Capsulimonadaceae bacterium]|nr:class II aldolase/adducin family protein [Capsulimonadaceae bacterium]